MPRFVKGGFQLTYFMLFQRVSYFYPKGFYYVDLFRCIVVSCWSEGFVLCYFLYGFLYGCVYMTFYLLFLSILVFLVGPEGFYFLLV